MFQAQAEECVRAAQGLQDKLAREEYQRREEQGRQEYLARTERLQQKIKNMRDTNTMLGGMEGTEQMIGAWEAELTGQPLPPPAYGGSAGGGAGGAPPGYQAPLAPWETPLSSRDATLRMLAVEQLTTCGSSGITAAMLKGRLAR